MSQAVKDLVARLRVTCEPGCKCTKQDAADALEQLLARAEAAEALLAELVAQDPVAWRTFDGEGGYDYCGYEDNEAYRDEYRKRNPKSTYHDWVQPMYLRVGLPETPNTVGACDKR